MELLDSLCIKHEPSERPDIERVLSVAKSVMAITMPMPTVDWSVFGDKLVVMGSVQELNVMKIVLQNNLGIFKDGEANPFELPLTTNTVCSGESSVARVIPSDYHGVPVVTPLREDITIGRPTIFQGRLEVTDAWEPYLRFSPETAPVSSFTAPPRIDFLGNATSVRDALAETVTNAVESPSDLLEGNEPDLECRRARAEGIRVIASQYVAEGDVPSFNAWAGIYSRAMEEPNPTESASGSISREEQIAYSQEQNPRHWNIVKVTFGGSRYYLSYICPPSANMYSTLRIVGGIHAEDTPEIQEICVYNSEPYWRELRHMMHQQVAAVREAVAS